MSEPIRAWKLLRVRRDKSLGPLFINRSLVIPLNRWFKAENHPTKGFAIRPGWHATPKRSAPHLSKKGRRWCRVELKGVKPFMRPTSQGGQWYLANWMRVVSLS